MATALDSYAPFDAGAGANVTEATWRSFMRHMRGSVYGDGVLRTGPNAFEVYGDASGMQVKVPVGECWIRGAWGELTSEETLAIAAADPTNPRKDLVILRNDFVNNRVELDVLTGTPAGSPSLPSLTQNTSKWEISLATVDVTAADTSIASNQVTDGRTWIDDDPYRVRKLANKTVTNSATLSDDTELILPMSRVATYAFECFLIYSATTTSDIKIKPITPSGATGSISAVGPAFGASGIIGDVELGVFDVGTTLVCGGVGASTKIASRMCGTIVVGTTAGDLSFQIAQNAAEASTVTLYAGSWVRIERLE